MEIKRFGYYWLDTWVLANVIQLGTQDFCLRFLNRDNDPCGRQFDQKTQTACLFTNGTEPPRNPRMSDSGLYKLIRITPLAGLPARSSCLMKSM